MLSQQDPKASQAGPQAYFRKTLREYEQTQSLFGLIPFEQKLHSSTGGRVTGASFPCGVASEMTKTAKVKRNAKIIFMLN